MLRPPFALPARYTETSSRYHTPGWALRYLRADQAINQPNTLTVRLHAPHKNLESRYSGLRALVPLVYLA